ncbi:unnamed protein product [Anisakis simplex]|uniref:Uncharacterized protein n=1 Tax=Anisakis simplex TaxID=6269 RepID=A0A3P6P520_ANISI|nr:unnamed protein product [Anisakis simplex]
MGLRREPGESRGQILADQNGILKNEITFHAATKDNRFNHIPKKRHELQTTAKEKHWESARPIKEKTLEEIVPKRRGVLKNSRIKNHGNSYDENKVKRYVMQRPVAPTVTIEDNQIVLKV